MTTVMIIKNAITVNVVVTVTNAMTKKQKVITAIVTNNGWWS